MSSRLKPAVRGGGEVRIVLPLLDRGREMEFVLPGRYDISPQDAGRIAALAVVREVVEA
jgi:DNA polymerase-3 subunit alpha